jgi:mRNA-degrading endonuclease RelE of RelBE toxin-antitoxin system
MPRVLCSEQARHSLEILPEAIREAISHRLAYLRDMPRMYPMTEEGCFPGCRTFWVDPCFRVFYMVAAGADDVYVVSVVEEEMDFTDEDPEPCGFGPAPAVEF